MNFANAAEALATFDAIVDSSDHDTLCACLGWLYSQKGKLPEMLRRAAMRKIAVRLVVLVVPEDFIPKVPT